MQYTSKQAFNFGFRFWYNTSNKSTFKPSTVVTYFFVHKVTYNSRALDCSNLIFHKKNIFPAIICAVHLEASRHL